MAKQPAKRKAEAAEKAKEATRNQGGRPRLIESPEQMQEMAEAFFADREAKNKPPTIAGLCYALGFSERHALSEYEKRSEFSATVKRLRMRIEQDRNECLILKETFTPGLIFDLKNNHNWVDKQEVQHSGSVNITDRINRARHRAGS